MQCTQNPEPGKDVYNRCDSRSPKRERETDTHELEKTYSCSAHRSRDDGGDVYPAQRRYAAGSLAGAVSHDGRSVGDFRVALRETEITSYSAFGVTESPSAWMRPLFRK